MSDSSFSDFSWGSPLSPEEADRLLVRVHSALAQGTLDRGDRSLLREMIECLGDSRGMVRLSFAETLGTLGTPATPLLEAALSSHPNPVVRRAAAKTLTLIADPRAVPTLVRALLTDEDMVVKGSAVGALARTGEVAVPALLEILASPDYPENYKGLVGWALAFIGSSAKDLIYQEMGADSPEVRAAVVEVMAQVAQENPENCDREMALLQDSLKDTAAIVRCEAATALGNLKYTPGIPALLVLLHHEDSESRKAAALSLMKIGDRTAINPLQTALNQETETAVKQIIQLALTQLHQLPADEDET